MKVLALDSSGLVASVAILEDNELIAEYTTNYKKTHSQTLLPMLEEISEMVELDFTTIDVIAIAKGPGSFTGLRIGSATAKGLGMAWNVPLVGIPTVDALAYNMYGTNKLICPIMDARRGQVYSGLYEFGECTIDKTFQLREIKSQCVAMMDEMVSIINELEKEVVFLGDGVPVFATQIEQLLKVPYSFAPAHMNRQRASSVGLLGIQYSKEGKEVSAMEYKPEYLRLSQAERERLEKENAGK